MTDRTATDAGVLRSQVEALASQGLGATAAVVRAVPLAGGASMETTAVDVTAAGETHALVVRRDMALNMAATALTRPQEFWLLSAAHAAGVKCPRPRWVHASPPPAFFVMDRCPGESVGRRVVKLPELAAARKHLAREMGREAAAIHRVPLDALDFLPRPDEGQTPAERVLAETRAAMDVLGRDNPVWETGLRWLSQHRPPPSGPSTLVHGDFRVGNLLVTPEGLEAVIDWEFAHVGDPIEDLGWPLVRDWRFENDAQRVGGVGSVDDLVAGYTENGGRAVDPTALHWWEIAGNLRWAVVCHAQAERHLSGRDRSVELASLGRKAAEIEWELLDQIDQRRRAEARP